MAIAFPRVLMQARVFIKQYVAVISFATLAFICLIVRNILASWQESGNKQTLAEYQRAKAAIQSAVDSQPSHPLYQDLLGQVYEWGAIAGYEDQSTALQAAKAHYLRGTQLRPLWPVTWASSASV